MLCPNDELTPFCFLFSKHDIPTIRTKAATVDDTNDFKTDAHVATSCHLGRP
jgi:hypothetical protein